MLIRISLLFVASLSLSAYGSAAPINFTFRAITAEVSRNGSPSVKTDLSISLLANTANVVPGGGYGQSDRYVNLKGFFTSKGLGISNVEGATPLAVHIGAPAATPPFRNTTILLVSGDVVNGIFSMPGLGTWDRISSIGPFHGPATASGPLNVTLRNGSTLSITTLESAQPYGNASFEATLVPGYSADEATAVSFASAPVASSEQIQGSFRKLSAKDLYLETSGKKVIRFRLLAKTPFRNQQGSPIRDSLLKPGDQLSVFVNPDDPETAVGVVLVREGGKRT